MTPPHNMLVDLVGVNRQVVYIVDPKLHLLSRVLQQVLPIPVSISSKSLRRTEAVVVVGVLMLSRKK